MAQVTVRQAMRLAAEHFRAGRLAEAEALCRQALAADAGSAEALFTLGSIAARVGRLEAAVDLIGRAIAAAPQVPEYHCDLGTILKLQGKPREALGCYEQAIALKPDFPEAHFNRGVVASETGQIEQAIASYRRAIELRSNYRDAIFNLANLLGVQGDVDESIRLYELAVGLDANNPHIHNNLASALRKKGRIDEAIGCYQRAVAVDARFAEAHNNLGVVLRECGLLQQAIASFERAVAIKPDFFEALLHLGAALRLSSQLDKAIDCLQRAVALRPRDAEAHNQLGTAWRDNGQPDQAILCHQHALAISPHPAEAHNNLGGDFKDLGQLQESMEHYRRALEINPRHAIAHSNLLFAMHYHPGCDAQSILEEAGRWNERHARPLAEFRAEHQNDRRPDRPLRIGYLSADFRRHVQSFFTIPLLQHHDHERFEIYCYSSTGNPDSITDRLRDFADHWRQVLGKGDSEIADGIRRDGIDILVDLTMHMAANHLLVFARKPAPVQVTWMAYPGTTGLETIDYRLTDPYLDPFGMYDACYSEKSLRLPNTFWCYDPLSDQPGVGPPPCNDNGFVTFGCLNNFTKVNEDVVDLWARVMVAVPDSRLVLLAPGGSSRQRVVDWMQGRGISADRVEFVHNRPRMEYLATYHRIDIALDTFPYNGHTTSLDAYWMGVPVITRVGSTVVGRAGVSQLSNLGLSELIGRNADEFVRIAVALAEDRRRLAEMRATLRQRMRTSPLMDAERFARDMEETYRSVWRLWCDGR
ncbi:MAG TPA: tetratricopeptide repeat protein [Tepidisphaeraceae bacterium]|nr:tetratricopeptide repeat protein [Tepidisphaeraceae bacterium]